MADYQTEEEQLEALSNWWKDNGTSIIAAVVIALASGFGWQAWKSNQVGEQERASDIYQAMLRASGEPLVVEQQELATELAEQLKAGYSGSDYAQFAALHLAAMAVRNGDLTEAEAQLRWVLSKSTKGSDNAQLAQLRLARVIAAGGDTEQALAILADAEPSTYAGSYALVRGDILLGSGRNDEARDAYTQALALASAGETNINLPLLQQKLQSLTPVAARPLQGSAAVEAEAVDVNAVEIDAVENDTASETPPTADTEAIQAQEG